MAQSCCKNGTLKGFRCVSVPLAFSFRCVSLYGKETGTFFVRYCMSNLCAMLFEVSCLNPITICCILLFLFILSCQACNNCGIFHTVNDDSIETNGVDVNSFSITRTSSKALWASYAVSGNIFLYKLPIPRRFFL